MLCCWFLLYNSTYQLCVYLQPSVWHLPPTPFIPPPRSSQSTEPSSLYYTAASRQPQLFCTWWCRVLHTVVWKCGCYSLLRPPSPSLAASASLFSVSASLYSMGSHIFYFATLPCGKSGSPRESLTGWQVGAIEVNWCLNLVKTWICGKSS